jgi:hypothetical protein
VIRPFSAVSLSFQTLLIWLLSVDFALIFLHIVAFLLAKASLITVVPKLLSITQDASLGEDYNYVKWSVIVIALVWVAVRDRWLAPLAWAAVFAMILVDDSMQLHENIGSQLSQNAHLLPDGLLSGLLSGSDLGEIVVFLGMGLIAFALTVLAFFRSGPVARVMSLRYLLVIAALGFFGVGLDALHQVISHFSQNHPAATFLKPVFGLFEDGGEMLVASVAVALTLAPPGRLQTDAALDAGRA